MSEHIIIKRLITPSEARAFRDSVPQGKLNGQTIHQNGEGRLVGFIAEIYMDHILSLLFPTAPRTVTADDSYDYDILLDKTKIDIKAKQRTVPVEPHHDVSIADYTVSKQHCDTYMFCSVTVDRQTKTIPSEFYYVGYMDKPQYLQSATFRRRGEPDGGNRRPDGSVFTITKDCWNLKYDQLDQFDGDRLQVLSRHGYTLLPW